MAKFILVLASINGLIAVALGAFGAHGLKNKLDDSMMSVYQTAVQYHMFHTLALLAVGLLAIHYTNSNGLKYAAYLFTLGIILFYGSLYALSTTGIRCLGIVTPIGGLAFLIAWGILALSILNLGILNLGILNLGILNLGILNLEFNK